MKRLVTGFLACAMALLLYSAALAEVPHLMNYQGVLTDAGGSPVDSTHDLTFKIYADSAWAAPALWTEDHTGVDVDNGVFNVILGTLTPLPEGLFADGERWIGLTVDSDTEMTPRMRITSVPWALRAAAADTALYVGPHDHNDLYYTKTELSTPGSINEPSNPVDWSKLKGVPPGFADGVDDGGAEPDSVWTIAGDNMYSTVAGNVGIGETFPAAKLDVGGDINTSSSYSIEGSVVLDVDGTSLAVGKATGGAETGYNNTFVGYGAGQSNTTGIMNCFMGWFAGSGSDAGELNTFIGTQSGGGIDNGSENVAIGHYAGLLLGDGNRNVMVGAAAGSDNSGDGNVFLGYGAGRNEHGSDKLYIASGLSDTDVLIYGDFGRRVLGIGTTNPDQTLDVAGTAEVEGFKMPTGADSGYVLTCDASGVGTWQPGTALFDGDWVIAGNNMYSALPGSIGVGTSSPSAKLDVRGPVNVGSSGNGHTVRFYGSTANSELHWNPINGALSAGRWAYAGGSGSYCFAAGEGATASADWAIALGHGVVASDWAAVAMGNATTASGGYSTAMGSATTASGSISTAMGYSTAATGYTSISMGRWLRAGPSDETVVLGSGVGEGDSLVNNIESSLMVGFRSDRPTLFVGPASGAGTTGKVGIGTTSPAHELHIIGTVQIGSAETVADSGTYTLATNANWVCATDGGRRLGSSTKRWSEVWAVDGTINTSDVRLKQGIADLPYGLAEIMQLHPVSFVWRDRPEAGRRLGLIAQEVQPVISEVVASEEMTVAEGRDGSSLTTRPAENLGIYYSQLVPVLVKAIQEQQGLIDLQARKIDELEARIAKMENRQH
jgi:hypothetical protein